MSDINILASQLAQFLAPLIPYLTKGSIEAAKSTTEKFSELISERGWESAKFIWNRLARHKEVKKAAQTLVKLPNDADAQAALRLQIKLALKADSTLVEALEEFLAEAAKKETVNSKGTHSVIIGGNAANNVIIAGDHNRLAGDSTTDAPPPESKKDRQK